MMLSRFLLCCTTVITLSLCSCYFHAQSWFGNEDVLFAVFLYYCYTFSLCLCYFHVPKLTMLSQEANLVFPTILVQHRLQFLPENIDLFSSRECLTKFGQAKILGFTYTYIPLKVTPSPFEKDIFTSPTIHQCCYLLLADFLPLFLPLFLNINLFNWNFPFILSCTFFFLTFFFLSLFPCLVFSSKQHRLYFPIEMYAPSRIGMLWQI